MPTMRTATMLAGGVLFLAGWAAAHPCFGPPEELTAARDAAFTEADVDRNGALDENEFAVFDETVRRAMTKVHFKRADADGDGRVTKAELGTWRRPRARGRGWRARP